jgi:hypothetical protein
MDNYSLTTEPRLINQRFALRSCIARTALADIYRANDMHQTTHENPEKNVLVLLVAAQFAQQEGFARAWQHTLSRPAPPSAAYPAVISYGEENGQYWLALNNGDGQLISEQVKELDERGLPLNDALDALENISHALSGVQAGPFGHLEPGAIQKTGNGYIILNAPLVKVLQQLPDSGRVAVNKIALHSPYISPSVAVGDTPVTEDDTFSAAALLYALLAGAPPFGEQSSLSAVTHDYKPAYLKKLNKKTWEELSSALAFQRKPRAENPDKLLTALRKTNKRKILFPAAVVAALGLIGFGIYHLTSKVGDFIQTPPDNQQQAIAPAPAAIPEAQPAPAPAIVENTGSSTENLTEDTQAPVAAEVAETPVELVDEPEVAEPVAEEADIAQNNEAEAEAETAEAEITTAETETAEAELATTETEAPETTEADTTAAETEAAEAANRQQQLAGLLQQAATAVADNQINDSADTTGALTLVRRINELDEDNAEAKELLNKAVENTLQDAEKLIADNDFEQARTRLSEGDKIIREFMLSTQLQQLVRLESRLAITEQEQKQVEELLANAREAIQAGNLSKDDGADDYALLHLDNLMFKQPDNADGLELLQEVAGQRQQAARLALEKGELEQAGTYLAESARLIRKYQFTTLQSSQQTLDAAYANATLQNTAPVAEIQGSPEIEVPDPLTTMESADPLPTEKPEVNPISIQEVAPFDADANPETDSVAIPPLNDQDTVEVTVETAVESIDTAIIPEPDTNSAAPIWESTTLEPVQNQPAVNGATTAPAQVIAPAAISQPVISYQPAQNDTQLQPEQIPQPQFAPANIDNRQPQQAPQQPVDVYTYQPDNQLVEPIDPQLIDQFNATSRPLGQQNPAPANVNFQPQQPQEVIAIPEMVPAELIPELEEIPLSDIEEILPAAN